MFSSEGEEHGYSRQSHVNFVNNGKASPLHMAVQSGDLEMIKMCLDNGAQLDLMEVTVHVLHETFPFVFSKVLHSSFTVD